MTLEQELKLPKPMDSIDHEALLSILRTSSLVMNYAEKFLFNYGVTDAQFNVLMILYSYALLDGMNQRELCDKVVLKESSMAALIQRMERNALVKRMPKVGDKRANQVFLTPKGKKLMDKVYNPYFKEVEKIMNSLSQHEKKGIITGTEKIRFYLASKESR